jgi:hypothetical protein
MANSRIVPSDLVLIGIVRVIFARDVIAEDDVR